MDSRLKHQKSKRQEAKKILLTIYPAATNIQLIQSGNYSAVYSFQDKQTKLIFKMSADYFPIESEYFFLKQAYRKRLTPKVYRINTKQGWIVMDFILGENTWESFSERRYLPLWTELGEKSKRFHTIQVSGAGIYQSGKFSNPNTADFIVDQIRWLFSKQFADKLNLTSSNKEVLRNSAAFFDSNNYLLHGDLSLNNCIRQNNKILSFIDPGPWRGGDPYLDLGHILSQALKYPNLTNKILNSFSKGYKSNLDWKSQKMAFCSLFWDLVVLRFLADKDKPEFKKRFNQKQESIDDRLKRISN